VGAELQKREQELGYAQQALAQQLQQQGGVEMDSLVSEVFIKSYGRKGYSISMVLEMNILYAEDNISKRN
jgi:outer membrane protein